MSAAHTVLVVEDDEVLRQILCHLLDRQGYHVLCGGTATEAIQLAADPEKPVDLLLTDVGLPGASGYHLAGVLLRLFPELQVIIMSGHAEADLPERAPGGRRLPHLVKPFPLDALLELVRELLVPPATGSAALG